MCSSPISLPSSSAARPAKLLLFANTEWYLFNFRLALAKAARERGIEVVLVSPPGPYGQRLQAEGLRWIPVPMARRSLNPVREALLLRTLRALYRQERPDIAHHFTAKCVVYGGLAARSVGTPAVVSAMTGMGYVFSSPDWTARMLRPGVRSLLRAAMRGEKNRLIVQNPDDRQAALNARLISPSFMRLIAGSGVDTQRYMPRQARTATESRTAVVVFAARLLWDKGIREFVEAARLLKAEGLNVRFLVAGEPDIGNPATVPEAQLRAWRDEGSVKLLGHVQDMAALMAEADLIVLPSYHEGMPRSLIEAAAAGLPIVTTDVPGCREVVENGVNGFLVPMRDIAALSVAIKTIVLDPSLAVRMGAASREKALALFDERLVLKSTFAVYEELLPNRYDLTCH